MADLLLEIGCEEIPAGFLPAGREALLSAVRPILEPLAKSLRVTGTPRRIILRATGLPKRTPTTRAEVKGPPLAVAFDKAGAPTRAAQGFAAKVGVGVDQTVKRDGYLWAIQETPGQAMAKALAEILPRAIGGIPWPKSMRWEEGGAQFVRPVRWILATLSGKVVGFSWAGLRAGNTTRLWRLAGKKTARKPVPFGALAKAGLAWDVEKRAGEIQKQLARAAHAAKAEPVWPAGDAGSTARYLADHCEFPRVVAASFDTAYLDAPPEVLILTMWRHQKFVPLERNGKILPEFLVVADATFGGKKGFEANVRAGASRVVAARLADARYFWEEDRKKGLAAHREETKRMRFAEGLGTVFDRTERLALASIPLAVELGRSDAEDAGEAARRAKADLASHLVFEFPELEGTVGKRLAETEGTAPEVAQAIEDHYRPKGPSDRLPSGLGVPLALADKADLLLGIFLIGKEPTASSDPYGLRRAAIGILRILIEGEARGLDLPSLVRICASAFAAAGREVPEEIRARVLDFLRAREAQFLADRYKARTDYVEAILASGWEDPRDASARLIALLALARTDDFEALVVSSKRVLNILEGKEGRGDVREDLLREEAERSLFDGTRALEERIRVHAGDYARAFREIASFRPVIDRFFDEILVNAPEADLRENRKRLLRRLGGVFLRVVDFARISS